MATMTPEDEYFAREDIEKRHKLAKELADKRSSQDAAALKAAHWMKCPKCGNDLSTIRFRDVDIDRCFHCGGTFLDNGELEKLTGGEEKHGIINSIVNIFRPPTT